MITALVDANVWLSYLVSRNERSTIVQVIRGCFSSDISLLVPLELIVEIRESLSSKQYFRSRVHPEQAEAVLAVLQQIGESLPQMTEISQFVDDPGDDYLIAYGVEYGADYLVTGDAVVRKLGQVNQLKIVNPAQFLQILHQSNLGSLSDSGVSEADGSG